MILKFLVEIDDEQAVKQLERWEDTVFRSRLKNIVTKELRGYTSVDAKSVKVTEVTGIQLFNEYTKFAK